jgi:hypothetical protein
MLRTSLRGKISPDMAYLLAAVLVLAVASLLVLSFVGTSLAAQGMAPGAKGTLKGEIIEVTSGQHLGMVTLRSGEIGQFPNDDLNIFVVKGTHVKICSVREPAAKLAVSRNATIHYHELGGLAVANRISEQC